MLAQGHLLLEDLPGMGKTTLAHALANALGLSYKRVQFTNDLLPADLLGMNIYDTRSAQFYFQPGPIFSQVLLADEINRASPKTQSALLEAMEERQVSTDGESRPLPEPFFCHCNAKSAFSFRYQRLTGITTRSFPVQACAGLSGRRGRKAVTAR
ncbi:MoxR protein [Alishewanella agri BL06]|uniref:MoxR protein n=1 Tax=Alishewanella agri BL06 TaxID=1195246 RepID=I8U9P8_9ALTE|nr:MoxR protein [Alishewanella agri BL06]